MGNCKMETEHMAILAMDLFSHLKQPVVAHCTAGPLHPSTVADAGNVPYCAVSIRTYLTEGRYIIVPDPAFLALGWVTWPFTLGAGPMFTETEVLRSSPSPKDFPPTSPPLPLPSGTLPHSIAVRSVHYTTLPYYPPSQSQTSIL